ncbi:MAG: iron ABC transporter permease, partial [Paracoccus sp. (in: a-proteobacteria)]|nr:iron ABC transporter permease [Paracoccus sp. (in: a-proteobacteria)]
LILAGLAVSFVIAAASNVVIMLADPRTISSVVFWMLGGFGFAQWDNLAFPLVSLAACSVIFALHAQQLNALAIGDETAATLGVSVRAVRLRLLIVSAFLTGVLVAFSGMIGFVGLMMPHIARLLIGGDNRRVLPASALLGAIFLVLADTAARRLTAPNDMPIGVVTGLIGGLFFIVLLTRQRG